jgi:hypothetical protein
MTLSRIAVNVFFSRNFCLKKSFFIEASNSVYLCTVVFKVILYLLVGKLFFIIQTYFLVG